MKNIIVYLDREKYNLRRDGCVERAQPTEREHHLVRELVRQRIA